MRWFGAGPDGTGDDATPDERAGLVTVYGTDDGPAAGAQGPARPPSAATAYAPAPLGGAALGTHSTASRTAPRSALRTVGAGVCLTPRHVLTCAHVINLAVGRHKLEYAHPGAVELAVGFPGADRSTRGTARLTHWIPPRDEQSPERHLAVPPGARRWRGDLAVLELTCDPPPGLAPVRWAPMAGSQTVRARYGTGDPEHTAYGRVATFEDGIGYVHGRPTGAAIRGGYSGGPVWSVTDQRAVGLVAAMVTQGAGPYDPTMTTRLSWSFSWQAVKAELTAAGADGLLPDCADQVPQQRTPDRLREDLRLLLDRALPDEAHIRKHASRFAERCLLPHPEDGSLPSLEEWTEVLVTVDRAVPALAEVLAPYDPVHARTLRELARLTPRLTDHWMSPWEERALLHLLGTLPDDVRRRVPEATRSAFPYPLPDEVVDGTGLSDPKVFAAYARRWVAALESRAGDGRQVPAGTPGVPALLRAVEFVAVLGSPLDRRTELRQWNERMAGHLGIDIATLADRRADADQWAQAAVSAPPRLVVELTGGTGHGRTRRYDAGFWTDVGDGRLQPAPGAGADPLAPAEIVKILHKHLDRLAGASVGQAWPTVELIVEHGDLEIDLDSLGAADAGPLPPKVVGTRYPMVLRCPSIRRLADSDGVWRRRWRALGRKSAMRLDATHDDPGRVAGLLDEDLDASVVVIGTPPGTRARTATWCLASGVPVLLWDRAEHAADGIGGFRLEPPSRVHQLPDAVREYRAKARSSPDEHRARPVLVWDDPGRPLPLTAHLTDPSERAEL
ncbi:trypsin-like peptidase domain-containing protein [Streptomyces sp. NPDC047117]|uniref:VMAP-C domain-containing protein n=1 Tax=Streptomyces sp. NPDC047117 TaxID=3155379 RepID=UPI0033F2570C